MARPDVVRFETGLRLPALAAFVAPPGVRHRYPYPTVLTHRDDGAGHYLWGVWHRREKGAPHRATVHRRGGADPKFVAELLATPVGERFFGRGSPLVRVRPGSLLARPLQLGQGHQYY